MSKDIYIEEYDRLYWEAIDELGMTDPEAAAYAERQAYGAMHDRYWDKVDYYRQLRKDEGI